MFKEKFVAAMAILAVSTACADANTSTAVPAQMARALENEAGKCNVIGDVSGNQLERIEGSKENPYASLAAVSEDPSCKVIEVSFSSVPLSGGITLRAGQKLIGQPGADGTLPVIENPTMTNDGRGVVLADKTTVSGLHITNTLASGVYGRDVDGVEIWGNEFSDFNTGLNLHPRYQLIGNFRAYFGGIHIEGATGGKTMNVSIRDNALHDALTNGVHIISEGEVDMKVDMRRNTLKRLGQHPINLPPWQADRPEPLPFAAVENSAIWVVSYDRSSLELRLDDTVIEDHGPALGTARGPIEFDGVDVFVGGSAVLRAVVDNLTYSNPAGRGNGFGDQAIQAGADARAHGAVFDLEVKNSHFKNPRSSHMALTSYYSMQDVSVRYSIKNNVMEESAIPWVAAVTVQHSGFSRLGVASTGTRMDVEFVDNVVRRGQGSTGDGFQFFNYGGATIHDLKVKLQGNVFDGRGSSGRAMLFVDEGTTNVAAIDVGGGVLRSLGGNSFVGFSVDVEAVDYAVIAKHNWWESPLGPDSVQLIGSGSVEVVPFLLKAPRR